MNPLTHRQPKAWIAMAALAIALPAWAAGPASPRTSIDSAYQRDRAACMGIGVAAERTSCLRDAGAARNQALRSGSSSVATPEQRERNAVQRCQAHKTTEDRARCERMARGEGTVSGSVEGGGTIRELVTQEPLPAPMPAPMPAPATPPPAPMLPEPAPLPPPAPLR